MPRDPSKHFRSPTFMAKLRSLKGLSPDEYKLYMRIGALVDVLSFNQTQVSNPDQMTGRKVSNNVPKPQGFTLTTLSDGFNVAWEPVNISKLAGYEVEYSENSVFSSAESVIAINTQATIKKKVSSGTLFVRVRTLTKDGECSPWTATSTVTLADDFFNSDQDVIDPENRTTVLPHPELTGSALDNADADCKVFTGFGAYVGPSPISLDDDNWGTSGDTNVRHNISYNFHENYDPYPGLENLDMDILGQEYLENDNFYTYEPNFYIRPHGLPGSFCDFFTVATIETNPVQVDVEFLRYQIRNNFYLPEHRQAGYVMNASMGTLKF